MGFFANWKFKTKLMVLTIVGIIGMIAISAFNLLSQKNQMLKDRQHIVEAVIEGTASQIKDLQNQVQKGDLTLSEAQKKAKNIIASYRYDGGNYLWINDFNAGMVMHPLKPNLNGKNLATFEDKKGNRLFADMAQVAKTSGSGYVTYYWSKPGNDTPVEKISYVKAIPGWNWIIGTGIYVDDVDERFTEQMVSSSGVLLLTIFISYLVSMLVYRSVINPLNLMVNSMKQVSNEGNLNAQIPLNQSDEIGDTVVLFNKHIEFLNQTITEVNTVMNDVSKGHFSKRINSTMRGDFEVLKNGINNSISTIQFNMSELGNVMDALSAGDFSVQMSEEVEGKFRQQVDTAMIRLRDIVGSVNDVMQDMRQGKFSSRIEVEAQGELLELKNMVNESMHSINTAIEDISRVMQAQSQGNLNQSIQNHYQGDLALLKDTINQTAQQLSNTVSEVVSASNSVANTANKVSDDSRRFAGSTQQQAATLEETAAAMEQITATVQQNTDSARHANQLATDARNEATKGSAIASQAVTSMNMITESSHKIADIITLIDGIAFQTNLLALNAAVEAARAGEHGRGFAVVAGEVRNLAQKSADAARDIKSLIEDSVAKVEEGAEYVHQSGEALNTINQAIEQVSSIVSEITDASSEQSQALEQVNQSVSEMDQVTQQNAITVEETSVAAAELNTQSGRMKKQMDFFNIAQGLPSPSTPQLEEKSA